VPTYNPFLTNINLTETRRYAGLSKAEFPHHLLEEACSEAQLLAKPQGIWQVYFYDNSSGTIFAPTHYPLSGNKIISYLNNCEKIAVMAVTIGQVLEQAVTAHFDAGRYSYALLLDAAGTTAVEMAADQISNAIREQGIKQGYQVLNRFSPGYGDWNITAQPDILELAHGHEINMTVTESCMLLPRKSITAVMGFMPNRINQVASACLDNQCQTCNQINCLARKEI